MLIAFGYQLNVYSQFRLIADTQTNSRIIELNNGNLKLMSTDLKHKTVSVNNIDNTPWKSFKLNIGKSQDLYNLQLLDLSASKHDSTHLFLLYSTYRSELMPIEDFSEKLHGSLTLTITNTKGDMLLFVDKAADYKILGSYPKSKLVVYKLKRHGFKSRRNVEIYNLNNYSLSL